MIGHGLGEGAALKARRSATAVTADRPDVHIHGANTGLTGAGLRSVAQGPPGDLARAARERPKWRQISVCR